MITVVISSYRYGHLAAHCVESILSQSVKPTKVMFVDDGVGDCRHILEHYPEVDFYENTENLGTVQNFQQMLEQVKTEYCMFIGADNWLRSDAIGLMHMTIDMENPDIITYDMILTGELKQSRIKYHQEEVVRFEGDYYWDRKDKHHGSMLYRTSLAKSVGGYTRLNDWSHQTQEDLSLWNKMINSGAKSCHLNLPLLYYRHHRENYNKY
jgi:glycosyltransferase involved in cell wall biosynthesis